MARDRSVREVLLAHSDGVLPDPGSVPVGPKSKSKALKRLEDVGARLDLLQRELHAEATGGGSRSVLLVLQGMDTSGKGGTVRTVLGMVNPHGVRVKGFGKPTDEERAHHYLWRIRKELPPSGVIGVFDRSHYEDILVPRVHQTMPVEEWGRRYEEINAFERELASSGITVVKVFLHISPEVQLERLRARLEDLTKHWKYNPADLDVRARWDDYQQAYRDILMRTSTAGAPWYVVPSDKKWYRNWAVASVLAETLDELDPQLPDPDFDVEEQLARIKALA